MATYWVSTSGNDANDGLSYAQAKATPWAAIAAASQGDTINIVNDGTHKMGEFAEWNGNPVEFVGTSWSDPGLVIRGSDSAGAPAIATMALDDSETRVTAFRFNDAARYILVQGLRFDYSSGATTTSSNRRALHFQGNAHLHRRFYNCEFVFGDIGGTFGGSTPVAFYFTGASSGSDEGVFEIANCVFINFPLNAQLGAADSRAEWDVHHNVIIYDGITQLNGPSWIFTTGGAKARRFYSNTVVRRAYGSNTAASLSASASDDTGQLFSHSNLMYAECGPDVASNGVGNFLRAGYNAATPGTPLRNSHNMIVLGTKLDTFYSGWTTDARGLCSYQYNFNFCAGNSWTGQDIEPDSILERDMTYDDVFFDTSAPWDWTVNGYTHQLPWDMRPLIGRFDAYDGDVVGAILDSINDPPVVSGPQTWSVTAGNSISIDAASGLDTVCSDPDGDTLSYILVDNVTHGTLTFNSTLGSYDYEPLPTYSGVDRFTFHVTDGMWTTTYIDSTTTTPYVQFDVDPYPVIDPGDGTNPVPREYLDVAPFFRPTLRVRTEIRAKSVKNRVKNVDLANYTSDRAWDESTHRVFNLGTNTATSVNLGGVETAKYLIVETDEPIDVSINDTDRYWSVGRVVALALTEVTSVHVRNNSTTNVAQVILAVAD